MIENYGRWDYKSTIKLEYLNVPVIPKMYIGQRLSAEAGPQVGFY